MNRLAGALLLLVGSLFGLVAFRYASFPLLVVAWYLFVKRKDSIRPAAIAALFSVLLTFSPVDILPFRLSRPPKIVPLVMGLPMDATLERAVRGEVILGGCVVTGFQPKYYLIL